MKKRAATHVSLIVLLFVLSRAEAVQAQKIKERLEKKAVVDGGNQKIAPASMGKRLARRRARPSGRMRERARAYEPLIAAAAARHKVDPRALWTIAYLETRFRHDAVSPHGARGLMQFMPATARAYGLSDPHQPAAAIDAAARHLKTLAARYDHRLDLVLASYHAGESVVDAYLNGTTFTSPGGKTINRRRVKTGGVPPYKGTQKYVDRGLAIYSRVARAEIFASQLIAGVDVLTIPAETAPPPLIAPVGFAFSAREEKALANVAPTAASPQPRSRRVDTAAPRPSRADNRSSFVAANNLPAFEPGISAVTRPRRATAPPADASSTDEDLFFFDLHSGEHFVINDSAGTENRSSALEAPQQRMIHERLDSDWHVGVEPTGGAQRRRRVSASAFSN